MFSCIWGTQISEKKQINLRIRAGMAEKISTSKDCLQDFKYLCFHVFGEPKSARRSRLICEFELVWLNSYTFVDIILIVS